jgi:hypothetical protein
MIGPFTKAPFSTTTTKWSTKGSSFLDTDGAAGSPSHLRNGARFQKEQFPYMTRI